MKTSIRTGLAIAMSLAVGTLAGCAAETPDEEAASTDSAISGEHGNCTAHQVKNLGRAVVFYKFNRAGTDYQVYTPGVVNQGVASPDVILREYLNVTGLIDGFAKNGTFSPRVMPELEAAGLIPANTFGVACEIKPNHTCSNDVANSYQFLEGKRLWRYTMTKSRKDVIAAVTAKVAELRRFYPADCGNTAHPVKIVVGSHSPPNHPGLLCQQSSDLLGPTLTGSALPAELADCNGSTPGE